MSRIDIFSITNIGFRVYVCMYVYIYFIVGRSTHDTHPYRAIGEIM